MKGISRVLWFILVLFLIQKPAMSIFSKGQTKMTKDLETSQSILDGIFFQESTEKFDESLLELTSIVSIVFIRHGASTSKFAMLSPNEYASFGIPDLSFSTLTPLGESQLWSYGNILQDEFTLDIYSMEQQIEFFIPSYQKSLSSARSIISGMHNNVPFSPTNTQIQNDDFVNLVSFRGVCYQCPVDSAFPMEDYNAGNFEGEIDQNFEDDYLITVLDDSIIDPDEYCGFLRKLMYNEQTMSHLNNIAYELLGENKKDTLADLEMFIKNLILSEETKNDVRFENLFFKLRFLFSEVINKHQYHMLPQLDNLPPNLSKLINKETYFELYKAEFFEFDYQNDFMANLWVSSLFKKMYGYIDKSLMKKNFPQFNFYTVHNNIMAAILYHFLGRIKFEKNFEEFLPQYASTVRFDVSVDEKDTHYVTMKVNGQVTAIEGCAKICTLESFKGLLADYIIEDYEEICQNGIEM